jgi:hypothetical protein
MFRSPSTCPIFRSPPPQQIINIFHDFVLILKYFKNKFENFERKYV